jgi:transposase
MVLERVELLELCRDDPEAVVRIVEGQDVRIKELEVQIAGLKAELDELKARLDQNSGNSNRPPSSDMFIGPKSLRPRGERSVGGQKGHRGSTLMPVSVPDEVVYHTVSVCSGCGASLKDVPSSEIERRQVFEVPPLQLVVLEHRAERKQCPCCKHVTRAKFPEDVLCRTQYGLRFRALVVYLCMYQLVPYDRIGELFVDLFGHKASKGTFVRIVGSFYDKLEEFENVVKGLLAKTGVLHTDETGFRVNGRRQWVHVLCTKHFTWYGHHKNRGSQATMEQGVLPSFEGVLVHDHWKPYFLYDCGHALCNAHLLRELLGVSENTGQKWSEKLGELLRQIKTRVDASRSRQHHLSQEEIHDFESKYSEIIKLGMRENPEKPRHMGKRGPGIQSKAKNLLDRCKNYQDETLLFMHDFTVPFENNQAERDIRMVKVQQKISGTFRSEDGAKHFCRIRAYISTLKKNKQPILTTLTNTLQKQPYTPTPE